VIRRQFSPGIKVFTALTNGGIFTGSVSPISMLKGSCRILFPVYPDLKLRSVSLIFVLRKSKKADLPDNRNKYKTIAESDLKTYLNKPWRV
jgi:hypothetical protein